jgi:AcrR family transcriptional regulator
MAEASTQDKLLDAAARLMAERGIFNVSLAEIVREAGQRNASAVHYHFGGRDEVLLALLQRHVPIIRARRLELLARAEAEPDNVRLVAEALVRPVTEFAQRGWRERAYLQIGAELITSLDRTTPEIRTLLRETAGQEAIVMLQARVAPLPPEIWRERAAIGTAFIGRAAADRARHLDRDEPMEHPVLADDRFVDNLVDMLVGAFTAPATTE